MFGTSAFIFIFAWFNQSNNSNMNFKYNDGGKAETGNQAEVNDCVVRAISIAIGRGSYGLARIMVANLKEADGVDVCSTDFMQIMYDAGFVYASVPQGKFKLSDLPKDGVYIAHTHQHVAAVINGTVEDTIDARGEFLKGYWLQTSSKGFNIFKGERKLNSWPIHFDGALKTASLYYLNYDRNTLITIKPVL